MNKPFAISLRSTDTAPAPLSQPQEVRTDIQLHIQAVWQLIDEMLNRLEILQTESKYNYEVPSLNLRDEVRRFEIDLIQRALTRTRGSQVQAAKFLGLNATTLNAKIKRYRLQSPYLIHYTTSPPNQPSTES
jgi:Response regulator containing CheY-like receiver, AAA-type ATPase, and DNA-binding domains